MELLKHKNDSVWIWILGVLKPITDNMALVIIICSVVFAIIVSALRLLLMKNNKYYFGLLDFGFVLSVSYAVHRLPIIHSRMNTALKTSADIILSSRQYLAIFERKALVTVNGNKDIASYFYSLPKERYHIWRGVEPVSLYEHLLDTVSDIRDIGPFGQIHTASFRTVSFFFISAVVFVVIAWFARTEKKTIFNIILLIVQSLFLLYTTTLCNGATLCAFTLWAVESVLCTLFGNSIIREKEKK